MNEKPEDRWPKMVLIGLCAVAITFGLSAGSVWSHEADPHPHDETSAAKTAYSHPEHGSLGQVGDKLSNPIANIWALNFAFSAPTFFDGDLNTGDPQITAAVVFEPLLPIPLFGTGAGQVRMVTRPIIPIYFPRTVPKGFDDFDHVSGIGDIQLPLLVNLPPKYAGKWLFGLGPVFQFPSATDDRLSQNQWALGPAMVLGYKAKRVTAGVFPNYFWKIGSSNQGSDTPDISQMSVLYFFNYMLGDAWQFGFSPTVSYNHRASDGNKWRVPIGLYVGKTILLGKLPVNIKVGYEYVVISQKDFGERYSFKVWLTPVIPSLIKNPIFGK